MFLWRCLCLPENNEYRILVLNSLVDCLNQTSNSIRSKFSGPVSYIVKTVIQYGFLDTLNNCLQFGYFGDPETWKRVVKKSVLENENIKWKASCILYGSLKEYALKINSIAMNP